MLKAKLIAGGIALAIIVATWGVQELRISWLKDDLALKNAAYDRLVGDFAVSEANVATLKGAVERQNLAIQTLQAQKAALDAKVRENALKAVEERKASVSTTEGGVEGMNNFFERLFR